MRTWTSMLVLVLVVLAGCGAEQPLPLGSRAPGFPVRGAQAGR